MEDSAVNKNLIDTLSIEVRLKRIAKCRLDSDSLFNRLELVISKMEKNFTQSTVTEEIAVTNSVSNDHNYTSQASADSAPLTLTAAASLPTAEENNNNIFGEEREYNEFSAQDEHTLLQQKEDKYPKQIGDNIILGPNGTEVDIRSYSSIIWSSAASATRQLLGFVFSSDILATHTLTGKPSPAFYGRERPAKMQLDAIKAADIIYCVRSKFQCTEREIRAAITTKCSDTSKKYKRRHQKQLEYLNAAN